MLKWPPWSASRLPPGAIHTSTLGLVAADFDTLANAALARKRLPTNSQTKATAVAINPACAEIKTQADCDAGVLTTNSADAVAAILFPAK